jgi:hypothetical protein
MWIHRFRSIPVAIFVFFTCLTAGNAAILIASNDWDYRPIPSNWTDTFDAVSLQVPATGGTTGHFLQVTFSDVQDFTTSNEFDIVYAPASNFFTGTYSTSWWFSFNFWASNTTPDALRLYFQSSNNASAWSYSFAPVTSTGWVTYSAMLSPDLWINDDPIQGPEEFLADLQSISWRGIYIDRNTRDQEIYGIDNFMLWAPEPAEWALIIAGVLLCCWAEKRRRAEESRLSFQSSTGPPASF